MSLAPPKESGEPCCDVCAAEGVRLIHFNLTQRVVIAGRPTTRGAGAITLCERCWGQCQRHSRRHRRPRPRLQVAS